MVRDPTDTAYGHFQCRNPDCRQCRPPPLPQSDINAAFNQIPTTPVWVAGESRLPLGGYFNLPFGGSVTYSDASSPAPPLQQPSSGLGSSPPLRRPPPSPPSGSGSRPTRLTVNCPVVPDLGRGPAAQWPTVLRPLVGVMLVHPSMINTLHGGAAMHEQLQRWADGRAPSMRFTTWMTQPVDSETDPWTVLANVRQAIRDAGGDPDAHLS